jgi:hypothetical protein
VEETLPVRTAQGIAPESVDAILMAARAREAVRNYLIWSRYPYERITSEPDGWTVLIGDARYHAVPEAGGLAGVTVHVSRSEVR